MFIFLINYPHIREIFYLIPLAFFNWIIVIFLATTNLIYLEINKLFNKDKDSRIKYKKNRQNEINTE